VGSSSEHKDVARAHWHLDRLVATTKAIIRRVEAAEKPSTDDVTVLGESQKSGAKHMPVVKSVGVFGEPYHLSIKKMITELEGLVKISQKLPAIGAVLNAELNYAFAALQTLVSNRVHHPDSILICVAGSRGMPQIESLLGVRSTT